MVFNIIIGCNTNLLESRLNKGPTGNLICKGLKAIPIIRILNHILISPEVMKWDSHSLQVFMEVNLEIHLINKDSIDKAISHSIPT